MPIPTSPLSAADVEAIAREIFELQAVVTVVTSGLYCGRIELGPKDSAWVKLCKDALRFALNHGTVHMTLGDFAVVASWPSGQGCAFMIDKLHPNLAAAERLMRKITEN